jgi:small-conductance mechanosensitive channel
MKRFWLIILNPPIALSKWLIFLLLALIVLAGATRQLETIRAYLDAEALSYQLGSIDISVFDLLRALLIIVLAFWTASIISGVLRYRIDKLQKLRTANRLLLHKVAQVSVYLVSFLITLDVLGVDLTTLTVFSGAIGIGLGFGLQKIASNFVSGLILLLEKSIEQDDLVEIGDKAIGFVRKSGARFTIVETFDGKEVMIPNEDFITNHVTNWTYSNSRGRVEISVGVAYGSDIEKAYDLMLEAAKEHPLCLEDPAAACFLRNFGDSSVDFILHFWMADVTTGRWKPQSEVMFAIWRKFKDNGIEIPFPQRDLHLKSSQLGHIRIDEK